MIERRPLPLTLAWHASGLALALLAVGPALWLLLVSLQPPGTPMNSPSLSAGGGLTLANFKQAWTQGDLAGPALNSVLVTLARVVLNLLLAALAAYPLARMTFKGRDTIFVLLLATMMIPEQVVLVPMFRTVVGLGLFDTLAAVVLPFSVTAFGIYLCRQAFLAIPHDLEEAARIDGCGSLRTWWHVMLPLAAPTLATLALFTILGAWSELLWPLVVLQDKANMTLPVAMSTLMSGAFVTNTRLAYAASVLALLPILAAFLLAQRFLKPDAFGGAVKG
jgi:putative chitobiose transport system permease protein